MDESSNHENAYVSVDSWRSWLACFASFTFQCTFLAIQATYGVFMVHFLEEFPGLTTTTATWVGISSSAFIMFFGPAVNMLASLLGFQILLAIGCGLSIVSLGLSSLVTKFELLFLTYSIMYGVASSIVYVSAINTCQVMFKEYVALATGLQASGVSVAVLALNPLMNWLIHSIGWRNTLRYWMFVAVLSPLTLAFPGREPQKTSEKVRFKINLKLLRDPSFVVWCLVSSVSTGCTATHSVHLMRLANDIPTTVHNRAFVYTAFGIGSLLGRLFGGRFLDINSISKIYLMEGIMFMYGSIQMFLSHATNLTQLLSYCLLMGVLDGIHVLLVPGITYELGRTLGDPGSAWGYVLFFNGIGYSLSPTTAGSLHDLTGNYHLAFTISGVVLLLGAFFLLFIPYQQWRTERLKRAADVLKIMEEENKLLQPDSKPSSGEDIRGSEVSVRTVTSTSSIGLIPGPAMGNVSLQSIENLREDCQLEIKAAAPEDKMTAIKEDHETDGSSSKADSPKSHKSTGSHKSTEEILNVPGVGGMVPIMSRESSPTREDRKEEEEELQIYMPPTNEGISESIPAKEKKPEVLPTIIEAPIAEATEAIEMENRNEDQHQKRDGTSV